MLIDYSISSPPEIIQKTGWVMQSEIDSWKWPPFDNKTAWLSLIPCHAIFGSLSYQFAAPNLDFQITSQVISFSRLSSSKVKFEINLSYSPGVSTWFQSVGTNTLLQVEIQVRKYYLIQCYYNNTITGSLTLRRHWVESWLVYSSTHYGTNKESKRFAGRY